MKQDREDMRRHLHKLDGQDRLLGIVIAVLVSGFGWLAVVAIWRWLT